MKLLFFILLCTSTLLGNEPFEGEKFKRAYIGICIVDIESGEELYSTNADNYFIPASLQKIPMSVAALAILGEDYCFKTELGFDGVVDEKGILQGNVWIRGGGDPTLSLSCFSKWEEELKKAGISKINGKIVVDSKCFESTLASPYWYFQDLGNYYGAGAAGLSINNNLYHVTFKPGKKEGDPAEVLKIDPPIPDLIVHNEVTTGPAGSGDQVNIYGVEYSNVQYYRGTVPIDQPTFTVKGAIPDPASFCASVLNSKIEALKGIQFQRVPLKKALCVIESRPLKEIFKEMNGISVNLFAEHLLKTIGGGSGQNGALILEQFLTKLGIPSQVRDGSGLARSNYLTARGFTSLLCTIRKSPAYQPVYTSFPEIGSKSTLEYFPDVAGCIIKAKTGSMSNIYNLGGYMTLPSGKELAFTIFCNNYLGPLKEIRTEMHRFLCLFSKQNRL